jgi:hypothetical protein
VAGVPFKRLLVYRLEVQLPLPEASGIALFAITKGFVIGSITTSTSHAFANDATYLMQDIADGETIGVVAVRAGEEGLLPMAVPDLPAGLGGPCRVLIQHLSGVQDSTGSLVFQISVSGPPTTGDGITVDLNQDGVPDELAEEILPLPGFVLAESFDDFYAGFDTGMSGVSTQ